MVKNAGNIARLADNLADERHAALITSDISRYAIVISLLCSVTCSI